jgi:Carboxypeptidase regulatory-like domain
MLRRAIFVAVLCSLVAAWPLPVSAQARNEARLVVTVVDQTGAVIPAAAVAIVGIEEATRKATIPPVKTSDRGLATFEHVAPGRYSVTGEFPGFDLGLLKDVRLKAGDNKHVLVLPLQKIAEEVTVGRDAQAVASDRASTFGTALTREQVAALSEDPAELQRQLEDMGGPGAAIRVDSFEGQQLPPKAQIKAVHITRDAFAAENHNAGGTWVDIITQPGVGSIRGNSRFSFYDSALDGRNPLVARKGPARSETFGLNLSGSLIKERSGFSVSVSGNRYATSPNLYVATPAGTRSESLTLQQTDTYVYFYGLFDYALTKDQTVRVTFSRDASTGGNQGVGAYDLTERAYATESTGYSLRVQEAGPLGRRAFINTRVSVNWSDATSRSAVEAPTVVVTDAFTSGGAQRAGGRHTRAFTLASDLDYVRGRHSWRAGVLVSGGHYRSDDAANYLGTYTFESLAAYEAGQPRSYTRRIGDPAIAYWNAQAGFYVQDDIRVKKNLTLTPGVRVEAQTQLTDHSNIAPRMGITWAPFKAAKTTLRASAGIFYDWLGTGTYEQTLRVDGVHQRELNILDPAYPDPGAVGLIPPTNRYLLAGDLRMPRTVRFSAGIDHQITKAFRVGATYARMHGDNLLVGRNLNAPRGGVRPDPASANVVEATGGGGSRSQSLSINSSFGLSSPPSGPMANGPRFNWKRGLMFYTTYYLGKAENDTDGAFSVPASASLADEWGPSPNDRRHQVYLAIYSGAFKNLTAAVNVSASSGSPYTIRTGYDDNGDLIFNDRPAGVGRNTERTAWRWNSYGYFTYTVGVGKRTVALPPGITISSIGGTTTVGTVAQPDAPRYRLSFMVMVDNLMNHANYTGYSGVMTSPFFLKPTAVDGVRTVRASVGVSF